MFAQTTMTDAYLFDIPVRTGDDAGFPGAGQAAMLQTLPATTITGGGRSLIRYDPVDKMLYRISPEGKWYRADGGSKRSAQNPSRLVPVPQSMATKAQRTVTALQSLAKSMDRVTTKK